MANANVTVGVNGIDKTGAAFNSIKNRAKATGASIRKIIGGAIAAAGAYLSFRSLSNTVSELSNMAMTAGKAGMSVEQLTKQMLAFRVVGMKIEASEFAQMMRFMEKNTGKRGEGAFWDTVKALSEIGDAAERGKATVSTFGRSGLALLPLVNASEEAREKIRALETVMPGLSDAAARAGKEAADAQTLIGKGISTLWQKVVGHVVGLWSDKFPGGVRAGALNAVNYFEYAVKKMWNIAVKQGSRIGNALQAIWNFAANDYSWEQAWSEARELNDIIDRQMDAQLAAIDRAREEYKAKLAQLSVDDLAGALSGRKASALGDEIGTTAAKAAHRITNQLMMGGSNAANRLSILGPEYQNETKKQTELLRKIAQNTEKTAENTDDIGENYTPTDL